MSNSPTNIHLTKKQIELTGKRFCTSCQADRSYAEGQWFPAGHGRKRWLCGPCARRRDKRSDDA